MHGPLAVNPPKPKPAIMEPRQFAALLRRWRRGHRLIQAQACAALNLPADQALISDYERGNAVPQPARSTTTAKNPSIPVRAHPAQVAHLPPPHPRPCSSKPRLHGADALQIRAWPQRAARASSSRHSRHHRGLAPLTERKRPLAVCRWAFRRRNRKAIRESETSAHPSTLGGKIEG